ncbi:MAG: hypothetical protein ABI648_04290 [Betaproteobacteria bacterium]
MAHLKQLARVWEEFTEAWCRLSSSSGAAPPELSCRDGSLTVILDRAERVPPGSHTL